MSSRKKLCLFVVLPRPQSPPKDWRHTVGMFRGDPIMKEVIDGALQFREEERRLAREQEAAERP
jgi:hypothetical protein